eukprot:CAMPEP_0185033292 /NCGR_PEP_ID=MMETSP1103-20130426/22080_1 /TAXON_ID=36769 /ORGANISM="Paraphysomonas bandaiensis, Strain Caron Lab Isolate" /LENGTH=417 /DNA_ID=CAMNT_0027569507 /DNA_START=234 /DNA_END=1487 /DNA_ORIENTATION=+
MHYSLKHPLKYDAYQTGILAEELAHKKPDVYFCVRALENGADPNAIIGDGLERPLHRAAKKGSPKIIEYLLQAGADINAVNARNQTALIIASDTKRVDSGYIGVIRFLCRFPGSKIEARDVGGNTPLLNAIFRNNVWVTRELLLAGAKVYRGERSPYEISLFILAHHIHLDIHEVPDKLLYPWKYSLFYYLFSPRGAYNRTIYTLFQLCTNSDIELVFKMVQHRLLDLESRGVNTDGPRDRPKEVRHTIVTTAEEEKETQDMLEKRRRQREEREARRKEEKRRKRQKSERERWENVKAGIVKSVEKEYSLEKKIRSEPDQDWVADSSSLYDDSLFPDSISIASSNRRHNSKSADNIESISESSSHSTVPGGKRWKVANKKSQVYSSNRAPGISVSVMDDYSAIGTDDTRRVTGAKRK